MKAVEFDLVGSLQGAGVDLLGFSVRVEPNDYLLTLRVFFDDMPHVAFVSGEDLGSCLIKATWLAKRDRLRWRRDKYYNS